MSNIAGYFCDVKSALGNILVYLKGVLGLSRALNVLHFGELQRGEVDYGDLRYLTHSQVNLTPLVRTKEFSRWVRRSKMRIGRKVETE